MAEYNEIVSNVLDIVKQYRTKMTLRQIYYRLVAREVIPNNVNAYKSLSRTLVTARERGDVDGDIMEDRGREVYGGDSGYDSDDLIGFIRRRVEGLAGAESGWIRKMWEDQPEYVEVWVEKDALQRLFRSATDGLRINTCVGRGYSSYTYVQRAVERLTPELEAGKGCTIIYSGDFDPSGLDIARDLKRRLHEYGASGIAVERIALTPAQIKQYSLPPQPAKATDARYNKFVAAHGKDVVELDALEPNVLTDLVRKAVEAHIDSVLWEATRQQVVEEREFIAKKMEAIATAAIEAMEEDEELRVDKDE